MLPTGRYFMPLLILFLILSILFFSFHSFITRNHIDNNVLQWANVFLLAISILSFNIQKKGLNNKNPHAFVRSVMSAMMLKMVLCIFAVLIYVFASKTHFNKRAIFISLFLYLIYLATEVFTVMKMNKDRKSNG